MSALLTVLGDWFNSHIRYRGFWYKLGLAALFHFVIRVFAKNKVEMTGGME